MHALYHTCVVVDVGCVWFQVAELSRCKEFEDVHLRVNEKRVLNTLNKDKNRPTIRHV